MNRPFENSGIEGQSEEWTGEKAVVYEYKGYEIRVHFTGENTLAQCIKSMAERGVEDASADGGILQVVKGRW